MTFLSCDSITQHFLFLQQVIKELDNDYFEFLTEPQILQEKILIILDYQVFLK